MSEADRQHWDRRYEQAGLAPPEAVQPPLFSDLVDYFPTAGTALEIACGRGRMAVWLASRGLHVWGVDVSPVAVTLARDHAKQCHVADRCRFDVHDLDDGLPKGDHVDLVVCYMFRDPDIDTAIMERLKPGGTLAMACLSEVGFGPGRFRAKPGALTDAFAALNILEAREADGNAVLVARSKRR